MRQLVERLPRKRSDHIGDQRMAEHISEDHGINGNENGVPKWNLYGPSTVLEYPEIGE